MGSSRLTVDLLTGAVHFVDISPYVKISVKVLRSDTVTSHSTAELRRKMSFFNQPQNRWRNWAFSLELAFKSGYCTEIYNVFNTKNGAFSSDAQEELYNEISYQVNLIHMLTLYYKPTCPFSLRVLGEAEEMNLQFNLKDISFDMDLKDELYTLGGKMQTPFLIDPERGTKLYESEDIITYLKTHYAAQSERTFGGLRVHQSDDVCDSCQ